MPRSGPTTGFQNLAKQAVFRVGETTYSGADVVLTAKAWSDWAELEQEARLGIACERFARATRIDLADEEVEAAADEYRTQRELLAADDAERWLAERQVAFDSWMKYIRRRLLCSKWESQRQELLAHYPVSQERLNRNIRVVGMCSGHFARFARKLAGRAAVHDRIGQEQSAGNSRRELEEQTGVPGTPFVLDAEDARLLDLSPESYRDKLQRLADLERSLQQFRSQVIVPERVLGQITTRHIDWMRIEAHALSFQEESMAREAALCLREDGEEISAVAARSKTMLRREHFDLGELEPGLETAFLSARTGEVIGPLPCGKEFKLFLVLDKVMPSAQNPDIKARAEQIILQAAIQPELKARVQWQVAWWSD
jgi:hypothetical protein